MALSKVACEGRLVAELGDAKVRTWSRGKDLGGMSRGPPIL